MGPVDRMMGPVKGEKRINQTPQWTKETVTDHKNQVITSNRDENNHFDVAVVASVAVASVVASVAVAVVVSVAVASVASAKALAVAVVAAEHVGVIEDPQTFETLSDTTSAGPAAEVEVEWCVWKRHQNLEAETMMTSDRANNPAEKNVGVTNR